MRFSYGQPGAVEVVAGNKPVGLDALCQTNAGLTTA